MSFPLRMSSSDINPFNKHLIISHQRDDNIFKWGEKKKRSGRKAVVKRVRYGILEYKGKEYLMSKKSDWAYLSEIVYENCRKSGDYVSMGFVFKELKGEAFSIDRIKNDKFIRNTVASANRWAEAQGLPILFECKKRNIYRRGT